MKKLWSALGALLCCANIWAQEDTSEKKDLGNVTGNVSSLFQYYNNDTVIGAIQPDEKTGINTFANINYTRGNFRAGIRMESYLPAINGYPSRFAGSGLGYRYAGYNFGKVDVTIGNFYDQFGNGLVFRSYEERNLGLDNAMDGILVKANPYRGIYVKGMYGLMRYEFDSKTINGPGIVRGGDVEFNLNELFQWDSKLKLTLGGSLVSKYQKNNSTTLILPENVAAYSGRFNIIYKGFGLNGEYAEKINDPSADNLFVYKKGRAALLNARYSQKGIGILLQGKFIDNFSFRSDRGAALTDLNINYLPAVTKQHTYNLVATMYPYNTQPNGEVSWSGELSYKFKRKSALGGKYGMNLVLNYSGAVGLDTTGLNDLDFADPDANRVGYVTNMGLGDNYYQDINLELSRKFNKGFKAKLGVYQIFYNNKINQGAYDVRGVKAEDKIEANIVVLDLEFKLNKKHSIRTELQHLATEQHEGNWATVIVEYTISPSWFFAVMDQWNYQNRYYDSGVHYPLVSVGWIHHATRISASYGRQKAGIFCIGGVCRQVPATNGLTLTLTSSF